MKPVMIQSLSAALLTLVSAIPVTAQQPATPRQDRPLDSIAQSQFDRPQGIFILDSREGTPYRDGTLRDANIRDYPFVSGYVLRASWQSMEPAKGEYDFKIVDNILAKLPAGQKLSLILIPPEPAYLAEMSGVVTWQDTDRQSAWQNKDRQGKLIKRAVPWDPLLRERRHAFLAALASHKVRGVALRDNPVLLAVNPSLPGGHSGIRDSGIRATNIAQLDRLCMLPGYTRAELLATVQDELRTVTTEFPRAFVHIGFWRIKDEQGGRELWEEIREALLAEFNGKTRPRVGFFMENLAASRPAPGKEPVSGYPVTEYATALYLSRNQTWTAFQALTTWRQQPFMNPSKVANATPADGMPNAYQMFGAKVANGTPADGMRYAYDTYGCVYFEHYLADIENPVWRADFQAWHDKLTAKEQKPPAKQQQTNTPSTYNPTPSTSNNKKFDLTSYKGTIKVDGDVIKLVTADATYVVRSPMMRQPGQSGGAQASKEGQGGNMQGMMKERIEKFMKDLKEKDGSEVELHGVVRNFNGESVLLVLPGGGRGQGGDRQGPPTNKRPMPTAEWLEPDHTAPNGSQYKTFQSKTVGREVSYLVWLPPGYDQEKKRYPVIYWLHGLGANQHGGATMFLPHVQEAIKEGVLPPVIVVSVNGMVKSFYCDSSDGQYPVESVIIKDLVPHVDATYRTIAKREGRVIEGFSMGGYGAGHLGFKYPELFGTVVISAGALLDPALSDVSKDGPMSSVFGNDNQRRLAEHPRELVRQNADKLRDKTHIRIGCGSLDDLLTFNRDLHERLTQLNVAHEYIIVPDVAHNSLLYYQQLGTTHFEFHRKSLAALAAGQ